MLCYPEPLQDFEFHHKLRERMTSDAVSAEKLQALLTIKQHRRIAEPTHHHVDFSKSRSDQRFVPTKFNTIADGVFYHLFTPVGIHEIFSGIINKDITLTRYMFKGFDYKSTHPNKERRY